MFPLARALRRAACGCVHRRRPTASLPTSTTCWRRRATRCSATNDGSGGDHGFAPDACEALMDVVRRVHQPLLRGGPTPMMRAVAKTAQSRGLPAMVSLDPLMVDGTGMCGGCRVQRRRQVVLPPAWTARSSTRTRWTSTRRTTALTTYKEQEDLACAARRDWEVRAMPIVYPHKTEMPCRDADERRRSWTRSPRATPWSVPSPRRAVACPARTPCASRAAPSTCRSATSCATSRWGTSRAPPSRSRRRNLLPAICGRVCPVEHQCELQCVSTPIRSRSASAGGALRRRLGAQAAERRRSTPRPSCGAARRSQSSARARPA